MLLVGTHNPHKLLEFRAILADLPVAVLGAEVLGDDRPVPETGSTFAENARLKAREFARRAARLLAEAPSGQEAGLRWVVADDSGLCVRALGGAPGVLSSRFAGDGASSADNNRKLLRLLAETPDDLRQAHFVCALACAAVPGAPSDEPFLLFEVEGRCDGAIGRAPSGAGGFGYDPIFVEASTAKTFAELPEGLKNRLSHRSRALERFRARFLDLLKPVR